MTSQCQLDEIQSKLARKLRRKIYRNPLRHKGFHGIVRSARFRRTSYQAVPMDKDTRDECG